MSQTDSSTHINQVGRVIVPVSDQDRAIDLYLGELGFEKRVDVTTMKMRGGSKWRRHVQQQPSALPGAPGAGSAGVPWPPNTGQPGASISVSFTLGDPGQGLVHDARGDQSGDVA